MLENDRLQRLIAAVTEGEVVDWEHERDLAGSEECSLLRALELVSRLADLHRAPRLDTALAPRQQITTPSPPSPSQHSPKR